MLHEIVVATVLVAITVAMHIGGFVMLLNARIAPDARPPTGFWPTA